MDHRSIAKFLVNLLTACGGGAAAASLVPSFSGQPRVALVLLFIATAIDSVDGTLTRGLRLKGALPQYDGGKLDEYADLVTFVVGPLGFAWGSGVLPTGPLGLLAGGMVCAASCLGFSYEYAKTDCAFWGWPSYWNILFLYAWLLELSPRAMVVACVLLSLAVFLPVPFAYPSRLPRLRGLTWGLGVSWSIVLIAAIVCTSVPRAIVWASLLFPAYYFSLTVVLWDTLIRKPAPRAGG
ncbi:MAG: hypothetical protein HYV63_31350 [Candidatus Schekmanbacteria bacterium]|nr:hypothetical protein [Candidatus Schekmanbacteria bacterium]